MTKKCTIFQVSVYIITLRHKFTFHGLYFCIFPYIPLHCTSTGRPFSLVLLHRKNSYSVTVSHLTIIPNCVTFINRKAVTKTCILGKILREATLAVKGGCTPAPDDTTSELQSGNALPGSPVKAIMSGGAMHRNQGGTVEYVI